MTQSRFQFHRGTVLAAAAGVQMLVSVPAWAAGSNMPWEQPLNQILQSVEGPVAKSTRRNNNSPLINAAEHSN